MSTTDPDAAALRHMATLNSFYDAEQRYVAAGGASAGADFGEMAAHLHPDVIGRQGPTVPYPGDWHGIAGIERFFAVFSGTWSTLNLTEIRYIAGDAGLAVQMRMQATSAATGRSLDTLVGHLLFFDDGLIREFTVFYLDPVQVLEATQP